MESPGADPHAGWCGTGPGAIRAPIPIWIVRPALVGRCIVLDIEPVSANAGPTPFTGFIVWPTFYMTQAQSGATVLSNCDRYAARVLLSAMRIPAVLEEGKPSFDRVQVKLHKFVCEDIRVRDFAAVNSQQLARVYLEAELRFSLSFGESTEHADSPIAPNVVVSRAEVGTKRMCQGVHRASLHCPRALAPSLCSDFLRVC